MSQTSKKILSGNNSPPPPDGGWGWMVVLGSFIMHANIQGVSYSFGVFVVALLENFEDAGRADVAWIGSIFYGTLHLVGPIASMLITKFGCQRVISVASVVTCVGFILSIWAPNIYFLYFSIGVLGGIGLGLIYVPAVVFISIYFENKRSLATGIASSGSGIGTIIFAPLSQILLDTYGWRGAFIIVGGLLLNCIPAGLLFRPLTKPGTTLQSAKQKQISMLTNADVCKTVNNSQSSSKDCELSAKGLILSKPIYFSNIYKRRTSLILPDYTEMNLKEGIATTGECVSTITVCDTYNNALINSKPDANISKRRRSLSESSVEDITKWEMMNEKAQESNLVSASSLEDLSVLKRNVYEDWVFSFRALPEVHLSGEDILPSSSCMVFCRKYDLILFREVLFDIFACSCFLACSAYYVPYIFLPDRANLMGSSTTFSSSLVVIIGVTNTAGRLLCGFISDCKCVNRLVLFSTALTTGGIVTIGSIFAHDSWGLAVYAVIYGLAIGSFMVLLPLVTADLFGVKKLTNAFGFIMMFAGLASLVGPPVAGWLYDYTESYTNSFVMLGVILITSGVMLYPVAFIKRCKSKQDVHPSASDKEMKTPVTKC